MVTLPESQKALAPFQPLLVQGTTTGGKCLVELTKTNPDFVSALDSRARANVIHCHVVREISRLVADLEGIKYTDALGFDAYAIGDSILLRCKLVKYDKPRNYQTEQQKLLGRQEYDEEM